MAYGQSVDQPLPRLPLVVPLESRYGEVNTDAKLINAFAEKDESGEYEVYKRQGVAAYQSIVGSPATLPAGQFVSYHTAFYTGFTTHTLTFGVHGPGPGWTLDITVDGGATYSNFFGTPPGATFTTTPVVSATQTTPDIVSVIVPYSVLSTQPIVTNFNPITHLFLANGTVPTASNGQLVPGIVWLDFTLYVYDINGNIWGSNLGDPTTWSSSNFIQPVAISGAPVGLAQHESLLVALKTGSIEFLYDAGNTTGSPLLPVPNSAVAWGCIDGKTVQNIENKLFWLAASGESAAFVAMLDQRQHRKISTPGVDRLLDDVSGPYYSFAMKDMGHTYYGLTAIGANLTLVYDLEQGIWYVWTDANGNYWPWFGFASNSNPVPIVTCLSLNAALVSKVFEFDEEFYADAVTYTTTAVFPVNIYTPNYDSGSRRNDTLQRMDFIGDQQPGILKSRWNDDDYAAGKWSQFRSVDLNQRRPNLLDNGSFRRRAYNFRWVENLPLRLEAVELSILSGTE